MRRLIRFACGADRLSATLDEGDGTTGLLCVTGGSQIRTGPHRLLHRLASEVAKTGVPVFRYDRRGVGDSDGVDPGYKESGSDLVVAAAAFRAECPHVRTVVGFGLCDGATTLALHGRSAGIAALALANPWLVETEPNTLPPAATRAHYRERLMSPEAWRSLLSGGVDLIGAVKSLFGAVAATEDLSLAEEVAAKLKPFAGKLLLILSERDGTAIAARSCWNGEAFSHVRDERIVTVASDSHTFARPGDFDRMHEAVSDFIQGVEKRS